ncbi:LacI family DNA-binding transcriptional regulator [Isoptericola croceus]|uniref:LacI family DNA-binding transcriptional regulator n=1 Tax=Isoptericola croceus TaxID=3031406 RepID=UPI0023F830FA|nr:LacI family DNA-binding transcriptional regulator [Isoptericola croceus]
MTTETSGEAGGRANTVRPPVTLRDVAREAGVGLATASRALDPDSRYVAKDVRARVLETAERLGYRPNTSARATTTGSTPTIAVLVSDIRDPYNAQLVHGAIQQARSSGLMVTISGTEHVIDDEVRVIRMLRSQRPRVMVLTGTRSGSASSRVALLRELELYEQDGGRIVVAGDDELPFDTAAVPRREGARKLVATLAGMGYRSMALITPDVDSTGVREWETGVLEAAREHEVRVDRASMVRVPMSRDGGYSAASGYLGSAQERADVLLAATDAMALGAMSALRHAGVVVGQEVGVAGFDDVVDADDVTPGLTSVDLSLESIGRTAVDLALQEPDARRRLVVFEARVVLRDSTPVRR